MKNHLAIEIRIAVAFVTGYQLCLLILLPYINIEGLLSFAEQFGGVGPFEDMWENFSTFSLGIMPYASAYVIVELCSLFLPFLKKHRQGEDGAESVCPAADLGPGAVLAAEIVSLYGVANGISLLILVTKKPGRTVYWAKQADQSFPHLSPSEG